MTQTGKAIALVSSFGVVGGVGAYAGGLFSNKEKESKAEITKVSISDNLKDEGFEILDNSKASGLWQAVLVEYKKATTKIFAEAQETNKTEEQLKEDCAKALSKEKTEGENYSLAKRWCVQKESMDKVLVRGKRKLLTFDGQEVTGEKTHWTTKINKLKLDKEVFSAIKDQIKGTTSDLDSDIIALKNGCKGLEITTIETTNDKFEERFALAKE